jgi:predicted transcriptional regulator
VESNIDKVDINILYCLYAKNKVSPLYSAQIKNILEYCNIPISYHTIFRRTQKLTDEEYLIEGYRNKRAKTFYLSNKGIEFIKNITNTENIYEEISVDNEGE